MCSPINIRFQASPREEQEEGPVSTAIQAVEAVEKILSSARVQRCVRYTRRHCESRVPSWLQCCFGCVCACMDDNDPEGQERTVLEGLVKEYGPIIAGMALQSLKESDTDLTQESLERIKMECEKQAKKFNESISESLGKSLEKSFKKNKDTSAAEEMLRRALKNKSHTKTKFYVKTKYEGVVEISVASLKRKVAFLPCNRGEDIVPCGASSEDIMNLFCRGLSKEDVVYESENMKKFLALCCHVYGFTPLGTEFREGIADEYASDTTDGLVSPAKSYGISPEEQNKLYKQAKKTYKISTLLL